MLPSNYISAIALVADYPNSLCFDTGIYPSDNLVVNAVVGGAGRRYLFGARNTNANNSVGQFGFYMESESTTNSAILYHNAQKRFTLAEVVGGNYYIENSKNQFYVNVANSYVLEVAGNSATFTGTRSIYLGCLNSGGVKAYGTPTAGSEVIIYGFRFFEGGTLIAEYCPVYKTDTDEYGLYDTVSNTFLSNMDSADFSSYGKVSVDESEGGEAYVESFNAGRVKSQMFPGRSATPKINAYPNAGYQFINWTINGEIVSTEQECDIFSILDYVSSADFTVKANFIKETALDTEMGYTVFGIQYGFQGPKDASSPEGRSGKMYTRAKSFTIKEDGLSKQTSTIECWEIPSGFIVGCVVSLMSPKGKTLFIGVIRSIEDNTMYCRSAMSLFDEEYIFRRYLAPTGQTIQNYTLKHIANLKTGNLADVDGVAKSYFTQRRYSVVNYLIRSNIWDNYKRPMLLSVPSHIASITNMEEYFQGIFNDYGLYLKPFFYETSSVLYPEKGTYTLLGVTLEYNSDDPMVFGDNVECITDISVQTESEHTTYLIILASDIYTFRGAFAIKPDGTTEQIDPLDEEQARQYVAYDDCVSKIVYSDDNFMNLVEGNLKNGVYNHKITFNIDLSSELFRLEDLEIGRRVQFYYGDKMYSSVITAKEFSSVNSNDTINSVKVTLGKVRNSLTEKLNLGKVK